MRFFSAFGARFRPVLDLVFPPRCVYCGQLGAWLCDACQQEAQPIGENICIRCGNPLTVRGLCQHCRQDPPDPLRGIRGVFFYNGPIAQGIRSLKYHDVRPLAPILARHLASYIRERSVLFDGLVPVPLHPEKLAARGFNQSELLAADVSKMLNIPLRIDLLERTRPTRPQAQLNRRQRLQNVADAFAPMRDIRLHGETLLLIDDVATTGATLRACGRALRQAGAGDIWALTVARAHVNTVLPPDQSGLTPAEAFLFWDGDRKRQSSDSLHPLI